MFDSRGLIFMQIITNVLLVSVFVGTSLFGSVKNDIFHDIAWGNEKAVKFWIKSKPDLMVLNDQGQTVLHVAVQSGNRKIVKMLTKAGVGLNVLDKQGKTALDHAVEVGHVKISYDLVKKKALIACAYNQQPLKKLIVKRMTKLYKIFAGVIAVGAILMFTAILAVPMVVGIHAAYMIGVFMGLPGVSLMYIGAFEIAGLGITSGIRTHRSYLMNQNI